MNIKGQVKIIKKKRVPEVSIKNNTILYNYRNLQVNLMNGESPDFYMTLCSSFNYNPTDSRSDPVSTTANYYPPASPTTPQPCIFKIPHTSSPSEGYTSSLVITNSSNAVNNTDSAKVVITVNFSGANINITQPISGIIISQGNPNTNPASYPISAVELNDYAFTSINDFSILYTYEVA